MGVKSCKKPDPYVYLRIVGHVLTAYLQVAYYQEMMQKLEAALPSNPRLELFSSTLHRLLTVWNVYYQILYSVIALLCDVTTVLRIEMIVPKWVRRHRFTLAGLLNPLSVCVSDFWAFFLYDREIIFPAALQVVASDSCNFVWHGLVMIYSFWEMVFLPKNPVTPASRNLLTAYIIAYLSTLFYTRYVDLRIWPYGFLALFEGSLLLHLILSFVVFKSVVTFFLQVHLRKILWKVEDLKEE